VVISPDELSNQYKKQKSFFATDQINQLEMGKRGHRRRSASQDEDNVGCVWGLMRMLYFRRDPKFLLDTKQLSARHTYREINGELFLLSSCQYEIFTAKLVVTVTVW
jgi:hypothetical protein